MRRAAFDIAGFLLAYLRDLKMRRISKRLAMHIKTTCAIRTVNRAFNLNASPLTFRVSNKLPANSAVRSFWDCNTSGIVVKDNFLTELLSHQY